MRLLVTLLLISLSSSISFGQSVKELFKEKKYLELTKLDSNYTQLSPEDLYRIGYAYYYLENDNKAIEYYDISITKGFDNSLVYFYKGLSLCYLKKYEDALKVIDIAINKNPTNQEILNQKGLIYSYLGQPDKALIIFEQAVKLPNTYQEPFYWVAYLYHGKQDFPKALALYYKALENISTKNKYYSKTLRNIGLLEYSVTKNYLKSAEAYTKYININPKDYEIYSKLIKAYNASKLFSKADSIFGLMKIAFKNKELSADDMKYKNISIDESEWNGQQLSVFKYLIEPNERLDIAYKVYLISKTDKNIERTFMVETTGPNPDNVKFILCEKEKKSGSHITYPYGWQTENITLDELKKAVILVLEDKIKLGASSNFDK